MARHIATDGLELFRVVVHEITTGPFARDIVTTYGPYNTLGTARGMLTREERQAEKDTRRNAHYAEITGREPTVVTVTGHIERANVTWEPVT